MIKEKFMILPLLLFTILSCSISKHKKNLDLEGFQDFKNPKTVKCCEITFFKDTPDTSRINLYFNPKGQLIKQIDYYKKFTDTTHFEYYNNGLLKSYSLKNNISSSVISTHHEYDKKKNLIKYQSLINNKLNFENEMLYDKKNNIIELKYKNSSLVSQEVQKYIQNYTENSETRIITDSSKNLNSIAKKYYDKKGNIIESIYKKGNYISKVLMTYDGNGNVLKKDFFTNNRFNSANTYYYLFDSKKNVIERRVYEKEKMIKVDFFDIEYY